MIQTRFIKNETIKRKAMFQINLNNKTFILLENSENG